MKIDTPMFGAVEIDEEQVIQFPQGLPGFEDHHRFKLFHEEGKPTVFWLQSLDDADLFFSVIQPELLNIGYEFTLTDEDEKALDVSDVSDLFLMVITAKNTQASNPNEKVPGNPELRANLNGPLIINSRSRKGIQKALPKLDRFTVLKEAADED
ncbi:MAG: flagellar assembly protein FliW [Halothiobacillaceae bacterium]